MGQPTPNVVRLVIFVLVLALGVIIINIPHLVRTGRLPRSFANPFAVSDSGTIPADSLPLDSARVMQSLTEVIDPELGVSVTELGLVHEVKVDTAGNVSVVLALTTPACPLTGPLGDSLAASIKRIPGTKRIQVRLDPLIPWDPSRLGDRARRKYESLFGIAPDAGR